jgi:hypothetical protein
LSSQGKAFISQEMVGKFRAIREKDSQLKNPKYVFGPKERAIAYNEAGLLWTTMSGAYGGEAMPVEQVKQFLGDEKIPSAYKRPQKPIGLTDVTKAAQAISEYSQ